MDSSLAEIFGAICSSQPVCPVEDCTSSATSLPPEDDAGNIEYKLKLVNPTKSRLEHLVTQLKYRLEEGQGEAIYEIGVADNGMMAGVSEDELQSSLKTLHKMACKLEATLTGIRKYSIDVGDDGPQRYTAEVLVRRVPEGQQFIELRIAVLGHVEAGKSTLVGVLTHGEMDNGRGRSRLNLFRHLHEIQSGHTSSISHEILGFSDCGQVINYSNSRSTEQICELSSKLVTLIDLAGHQKYMRTTVFGLTCYQPDFAMLVVAGNAGIVETAREHLGYAVALKIPICIVVTKIDVCPAAVVSRTLEQIQRTLKSPGCNKVPLLIRTEDDVVSAATNFKSDSVAPIFTVSNVTGKHIDWILKFLNVMPSTRTRAEQDSLEQEKLEFQIDETFSVPSAGTVVGGKMLRGVVREGDSCIIGPDDAGQFSSVTVISVHCNRSPCRMVRAGQPCCLAIVGKDREEIRKGMVVLSGDNKCLPVCREFEAKMFILYGEGAVRVGFEATVHIGGVMQTAAVVSMGEQEELYTGDEATIHLRFIKQPEYVTSGCRLLFRRGQFKSMGTVGKLFPLDDRLCV